MPTSTPARPRRGPLVALLVIYLVLLVWTIVWKLTVPMIGGAAFLPHPVKLIPFVASGDAGASIPRELIANLALFVPFGVYLRLLHIRVWLVVVLAVASSALLEATQHLLSVGIADSTDVIMNTAGAALGVGLMAVIRRWVPRGADSWAVGAMTLATVLGVAAIAGILALGLRYSPQQDVVVRGAGMPTSASAPPCT